MKKLHWTQRPENKERLSVLARARHKMRRQRLAVNGKAERKVHRVMKRVKHAKLVDLAHIGAEVRLAQLQAEVTALKMFLRSR